MKAFSIAVAVTLVLAFICILQSSAVPFTGQVHEQEEAASNDTPVAAYQEMSTESMMMPDHFRQKRQSHLSMCRWCCKCCRSYKGCGYCCKF
ncbi:hepcidin-1 [Gasterosteus aculeatus]|uniref:hepcidin-1 isoform X1 n=1 Tax=Gasterosteus aculeatus aculeatus TaxID=481459 RepID=UPI001A9908FC|nr:hepcidin-1 isoform X1 [Gasterosteus aculeatus aculeatus]